MKIKEQFLRDGYKLLNGLTKKGEEVFKKVERNGSSVKTDFAIFDKNSNWRNVSREVDSFQKVSRWGVKKSPDYYMSASYYPRAVGINKYFNGGLRSEMTAILSKDGKEVDSLYRNGFANGEKWSSVKNFKLGTYYQSKCPNNINYVNPQKWTKISDLEFV